MANNFPIFGNENVFNPDEVIDLFLNSTADGFAIVDMENRFVRVNHMYTEIFGYTEDDVIGRRFDEFSMPHFVKALIREVQEGKSYTNMITQRFHKDGSVLDIAVSYSPLRNRNGEIIAIIAIYRDITGVLQMDRELKRTRELYELITENTIDMILVFTKDKEVLYASPSHEKVIGIHPEKIIGKKLNEFLSSEEAFPFDEKLEEIISTKEPRLVRKNIKTINNELVYTEYNISPILNENDEIESFVSVGRNITDRVKNDAALRNLDRLSIIGQLAAGVAHEIRNPLTSLKGFSKLLKTSTDTSKQSDYLSIITAELDRIDMIVNEFMSLAKPQAVKFEYESLTSILDSTINVLYPQALLHNVQIHTDYQDDQVKLLCSPQQLKQVFVNFLKNAIEAMPSGGNVLIQVRKNHHNKVTILFSDEGPGIESDLMRHLGTPFYTTKDKGIGLGLTVSNKIIQEHKGTMHIESEKGKGTTVSVELTID